MFLKTVVCRNPVRTGSDVAVVSSLDLIGRLSASRNVAVEGQNAAIITADHVGLCDVVRPR